MIWNIVYSAAAREDLKAIYEYIAYELFEPKIASKQVETIMDLIKKLDEMPEKYPLYHSENPMTKDLHKFPVGNYIVFYRLQEEKQTVSIVRVLYGGSNIDKQL